MPNKFTVFVVFAAVAQATLASATEGSSDLGTAQEKTRAAWRQWAEVICKSVRNKSWSMEEARDQFRSYQVAGRTAFLSVAPPCDDPSLLIEIGTFATVFRDGIFSAIWAAKNCKNYTATKAAIENEKTQLPYEQIVRDFHKLTKDTGSPTSALESLKLIYEMLFAELEKLLEVTCGGEQTISPCAINEIHDKIDALIKIVYSWLAKVSVSSTLLQLNINVLPQE